MQKISLSLTYVYFVSDFPYDQYLHSVPSYGVLLPHNSTDRSSKIITRYPCSGCSSTFARKNGLAYHQKFACNQSPRFRCAYCSYIARHISNTRKHIRNKHPSETMQIIDVSNSYSVLHHKADS